MYDALHLLMFPVCYFSGTDNQHTTAFQVTDQLPQYFFSSPAPEVNQYVLTIDNVHGLSGFIFKFEQIQL